MKECFKCGATKPAAEFYRHPRMGDGRLGKCKECAKADVIANRAKKIRYYQEYDKKRYQRPERKAEIHAALKRQRKANPEKAMARSKLQYALKSGSLIRLPCEVCGKKKSQAHHEDYFKPLEIRWLCFRHHREAHGQTIL